MTGDHDIRPPGLTPEQEARIKAVQDAAAIFKVAIHDNVVTTRTVLLADASVDDAVRISVAGIRETH